MAIPKFFEVIKPFLVAVMDGNEHTLKELRGDIGKALQFI